MAGAKMAWGLYLGPYANGSRNIYHGLKNGTAIVIRVKKGESADNYLRKHKKYPAPIKLTPKPSGIVVNRNKYNGNKTKLVQWKGKYYKLVNRPAAKPAARRKMTNATMKKRFGYKAQNINANDRKWLNMLGARNVPGNEKYRLAPDSHIMISSIFTINPPKQGYKLKTPVVRNVPSGGRRIYKYVWKTFDSVRSVGVYHTVLTDKKPVLAGNGMNSRPVSINQNVVKNMVTKAVNQVVARYEPSSLSKFQFKKVLQNVVKRKYKTQMKNVLANIKKQKFKLHHVSPPRSVNPAIKKIVQNAFKKLQSNINAIKIPAAIVKDPRYDRLANKYFQKINNKSNYNTAWNLAKRAANANLRYRIFSGQNIWSNARLSAGVKPIGPAGSYKKIIVAKPKPAKNIKRNKFVSKLPNSNMGLKYLFKTPPKLRKYLDPVKTAEVVVLKKLPKHQKRVTYAGPAVGPVKKPPNRAQKPVVVKKEPVPIVKPLLNEAGMGRLKAKYEAEAEKQKTKLAKDIKRKQNWMELMGGEIASGPKPELGKNAKELLKEKIRCIDKPEANINSLLSQLGKNPTNYASKEDKCKELKRIKKERAAQRRP
jgi:hypothetical protein